MTKASELDSISTSGGAVLNTADDAALRSSYTDLSDLDPRTIDRARVGFRRAYATAQDVVEGRIDPLSV